MSHIMSSPDLRETSGARSNWGWIVALGVVFIILGCIALANMLMATVASVFFVGSMMLLGGVAQIVLAFPARRWGRFFLWLLMGLLYVAAGFLTFRNPILASSILTLVLAFSLVFAGAVRVAVGIASRPERGWGWLVAAGVMSLIVGIVIALGWPVNTLWVLGLILGIDLVVAGVSYVAFGLALHAPT